MKQTPSPENAPELSLIAPSGASLPVLRLLGGLSIGASDSLSQIGYESRFHVRAVLALAGADSSGMTRDELVEILWPKSDATAARNRLYHTVHLARQALAVGSWDDEWIVVRHARVLLDKRVWCDVHQLELACQRVPSSLSDEEIQNMLPLCENDWMPDLDIGHLGDTLRAKIRTLQASVLREAVSRSQRYGSTTTHRQLLLQLLRLQPTEEWAHRELMRLNLDMGRNHAVLRTYESLSRDLSMQLGLKPNAETSEIAALAATRLRAPPKPLGGFSSAVKPYFLMGRESLLEPLVELLKKTAGVWNIYGLGGVGKTVLACELGRRLESRFSGNVFMLSVSGYIDLPRLARACLEHLGVAPSELASDIELLREVLLTREVLLIIDDIHPDIDLQPLFDVGSQVRFLSRVLLVAHRRWVSDAVHHILLTGLEVPAKSTVLSKAVQSPSFELFEVHCPVVGAHTRSASWQQEVVSLLEHLEGLPLAIELAAAQADVMTPGEILAQLVAGSLKPLSNGPYSLAGPRRSLSLTFDHGMDLLDEKSRCAYLALSFFNHTFTSVHGHELMSGIGLSESEADDALTGLQDSGFLTLVSDAQPALLRMPRLVRLHARERLATVPLGRPGSAMQAHRRCIHRQVQSLPLNFASPLYAGHFKQLLALEDDAVAVLKTTQLDDPSTFVHVAATLFEVWDLMANGAFIAAYVDTSVALASNLRMWAQELQIRMVWVRHLVGVQNLPEAQSASQAMMDCLFRSPVDTMTTLRVTACRARVLAKLGNAHLAQDLLRQTSDRLSIANNSDEFWALQTYFSDVSHSDFKPSFDLDVLRPRFQGSRLWLAVLQLILADHQKAGKDAPDTWHDEVKRYADMCGMFELSSVLLRA